MSIEIAESLRLKIEVQKCLPFAARGNDFTCIADYHFLPPF
ncbi:unnamed protein product [Brassica oleracea]